MILNADLGSEHSYLIEYYNHCKSGEYIAGRELMMQLELLIHDYLDRECILELADAHKRIKFIEEKCKHFEAPFAGKPFILLLWQKAVVEALYGIKVFDDELNRYRRKHKRLTLLIGRKNGKTPFAAALALAEYFCGNMGTKILCASNDYEQADICFQAINNMREESPALERVTRKNIRGIFFGNPKQKKKRGKFTVQNKGNIRKLSARSGAKEGRNVAFAIADEVHEMADNSLIMPVEQSLSTQDEPIFIEITTEGIINDGYLDEDLAEARQVLRGELDRPDWLIWLYTQDSESEIWQDEQSWYKSNPSLGVVKKWSYLRGMLEKAKISGSDRSFVLAKDFDIKQNNAQAWLDLSIISNKDRFILEQFRGCWCVVGIDISETTDLTACTLLFVRNGKKYAWTRYFVPESKADEKLSELNGTNPEHKNYREWAKQGLVTIIPGNEIDTSQICEWLFAIYREYQIRPYKIGYDQYDAKAMVRELKEFFGDETTERIGMDFNTLSNPMRSVEADLRSRDLIYDDNPIDVWCFENTAIRLDTLGRIMPVKVQGKSDRRIDGTVSKIIAYAVLGRYRKEYMALAG